jgi:ATP-dependent DNA helicase RecQ
MKFDRERALELLRKGTGLPHAVFHENQDRAIQHVVEGDGSLLVVQKTGWGKSNVYFIATKLLRDQGAGPALLISPLLSLMRNQIDAARRMGVRAETINSSNRQDWEDIIGKVHRDEVDILLISPERLANREFLEQVLGVVAPNIVLLVVDEAHCISDWGHDFRPDYRRIERLARLFPANLRLLATTATANRRVMDDLRAILGPNLHVLLGDLNRPSLTLQTIQMPSQIQRMAWLAENLPKMRGSGIIYTLTVGDAERLTTWLKRQKLDVEVYTGQMDNDERERLENLLLENRVKALVATVALGMGFDKPDLGYVIHYQAPGSVVSYYQQVGRAGRDGNDAYGILLSGKEETDIVDFFIRGSFPTLKEVDRIVNALERAPNGLSSYELQNEVNIRPSRLTQATKIIALESPAPIVQQGRKWQLTPTRLSDSFWGRIERLTELRKKEQRQMQAFVSLPRGHMEFLIDALDGDPGGVAPSRLPPLPSRTNPLLVEAARRLLRSNMGMIKPRKMWPPGMGLSEFRGNIPQELQPCPGISLCDWNDGGWGTEVSQGKYTAGQFSDELVEACASLVRRWSPSPAPQWVACIPSRRNPVLVPDFARRLAQALNLPFDTALLKVRNHPPQKEMANSAHQCRNLVDTMQAETRNIQPGPVLLVDDIVDSRWTFTMAAWLLREAGSGEVWPLALSNAKG